MASLEKKSKEMWEGMMQTGVRMGWELKGTPPSEASRTESVSLLVCVYIHFSFIHSFKYFSRDYFVPGTVLDIWGHIH